MLKLYNFGWGPYPRRVTIYLAEKGISDIELVEVEFPHRPELWPEGFLLKLNPAHSLPVLDTGKGALIGQSIAILEYLEELYPSPNMLGETPEEHARARELVSIFEEATAFFGIWARQGRRLNADRHRASAEAADRTGVCRDFAHLAVAFCRCINIPARYCAGYLGDIGVPASDALMDFSAWLEAYLGGEWYTFDARNNIPRIGRVLLARGRDAADVAISTSFGPTLSSFTVWTEECDGSGCLDSFRGE